MVKQQSSHKHPDSDQRIKAPETQMKKLQKQVGDLQGKLESHDHPHTH